VIKYNRFCGNLPKGPWVEHEEKKLLRMAYDIRFFREKRWKNSSNKTFLQIKIILKLIEKEKGILWL